MGRNFIVHDENPAWWHFGRIVQIKNTSVWETRDRIGIVRPGDSSEESWTGLSQIEDSGEKKYRAQSTNSEFWSQKRELWKTRRGQESGDKTACTKNSWRLLAMELQRAVFLKETVAVSATMSISVEQWHHQIRLQILHREPEVPEAEVPVVECLDGPARITSKEFALTHFVKSGTLQNACTTRPRVVVGLGKSAHTHIVRLMNSRLKGPKRMMTKVQWLCWRKMIGAEQRLVTDQGHDRADLVRNVITSWNEDLLDVDHVTHGNWVVYFKTWSRRSLFSGRAQTCRDQSNV